MFVASLSRICGWLFVLSIAGLARALPKVALTIFINRLKACYVSKALLSVGDYHHCVGLCVGIGVGICVGICVGIGVLA